jgi:hypothetical protein
MMRQPLYAQLEVKPHSLNPQQLALALRAWDMMLEEYSERHLSFVADNLSALSGLAALFHEAYGTTYAAGLWEEHLPAGLAWYVRVNDTRAVGERSLAPSWSWASVGKVRIKLYRATGSWQSIKEASAEVIKVCCTPANAENPFGSLQQGVITMKAWLRTGRLSTSQSYAEARVNLAYSGRLDLVTGVEEEVLTKTFQARYPGLVLDMDSGSSVADVALDRDMTSGGSRVVSCALLAADSYRNKCQATLLILERDSITGLYSRLGIAILGPGRIGWMGLGTDRDSAFKRWGRPRCETIQIV